MVSGRTDGAGGGAAGTAAVDMSVRAGPLLLKNPVLLAAGTAGYGRELGAVAPLSELGGIIVKGVASVPWEGNPHPRMVETPAGLINSIGLENPGVDHFLAHDLPWLRRQGATVIVNVIGHRFEDYVDVARRLRGEPGIAALELNVSCPNVDTGLLFGHDARLAARLTEAVKEANPLPLFVKLSPNAADPLDVCRSVLSAGADGLSLMNTYLAVAIDVRARRPVLPGVMGGLSGPAVKPLTLRWIWEAAARWDAPILGMGGVAGVDDALEFMMAGAAAVAVGSATFTRADAAWRIAEGLAARLAELGFERAQDAVRAAHGGRVAAAPAATRPECAGGGNRAVSTDRRETMASQDHGDAAAASHGERETAPAPAHGRAAGSNDDRWGG